MSRTLHRSCVSKDLSDGAEWTRGQESAHARHIVSMRNIGIETLTHKVNIVFVALESGYCNRS